jgi:uncharacterized spore protein YtfJ
MDVETLIAKASDALSAGRSFGPIIEREGSLVIPAAFAVAVGGGGGGGGPTEGPNAGSGGGGGVVSVSWPVGAYVVRGDDVRWIPAVDATRIALAGILVVRTFMRIRAARRTA